MRQHCQRSVSSPTLYLGCIRLSSQQEAAKQGARLFTHGRLAVEPITTPIVTCPADKRFGNSDLAGAGVAAASGEKARSGQKQLSQESSCRSARHILSFVSVFDHVWKSRLYPGTDIACPVSLSSSLTPHRTCPHDQNRRQHAWTSL